jgi:ParB family chromosome partitioning protein
MSDALDALFRTGSIPKLDEPEAEPPATIRSGVCNLPIDALVDLEQPFQLYSEREAELMRRSIAAHGVIQRLVVRPYGENVYQIISGRNRRNGARAAGLTEVPCEVRDLADDEAVEQMIETNLSQRPKILPRDRAGAYRKLLEIAKRQGEKIDSEEDGGTEFHKSRDALGSSDSLGGRQVQNYVSLTNLIPDLLEMVDEEKLSIKSGVQLSYLSTESQAVVHDYFFAGRNCAISEELASAIRAACEKKPLTRDALHTLVSGQGNAKKQRVTSIPFQPIKKFFSRNVSKAQVQATTAAALKFYFEHGQAVVDDETIGGG